MLLAGLSVFQPLAEDTPCAALRAVKTGKGYTLGMPSGVGRPSVIVLAVACAVALPHTVARADSPTWSVDARIGWTPGDAQPPEVSRYGGHLLFAVGGRYLGMAGPLVYGAEGFVGRALALGEGESFTPVEIEPRVGVRLTRVRLRPTTIDEEETLKVECGSTVCIRWYRIKDRATFMVRHQRDHMFLLGLRTRVIGQRRLAPTLAWRVQAARAIVERTSGQMAMPTSVGLYFELGGALELDDPEGTERLGPGLGGHLDAGLAVGKRRTWFVGTRLGLTGLKSPGTEDRGEFLLWLYLGVGAISGR